MRGAACENTTIRQFTRGEGETRGHAVSHAEGDLKDKETMKCEHRRDVFEVTPTSPAPTATTTTTTTTTTTSAQPLPSPYQLPFPIPPSFPPSIPSGWLHHALLARGVVESSVAVLANDAPLPTHTHPHVHTYTLLFTDQLLLR